MTNGAFGKITAIIIKDLFLLPFPPNMCEKANDFLTATAIDLCYFRQGLTHQIDNQLFTPIIKNYSTLWQV